MNKLEYSGASDIGLVRGENQDCWVADEQQGLFLVADGMGGNRAGKLAADIVVEILPRLIRQRVSPNAHLTDKALIVEVTDAMVVISDRLRDESQQRDSIRGMGSTAVLALVRQGRALIGHLGDSRAYLLHEGRLRLLTQDHSLAQALVANGAITTGQAADHPGRARLTRYVGMKDAALPEVQVVPLAPGDRLLLCTDGLHGLVPHKRLETILSRSNGVTDTCHQLIAAAKKAGGTDNVTAVVVAVPNGYG